MTQVPENAESSSLRQWVLGLAIAIFSCAIFFHIVNGFLADTQEKLAVTQFRVEYLQARLDRLETAAAARLTTPVPAAVSPTPTAAPAPTVPPAPVLSLPALIKPPPAMAPEIHTEKVPDTAKPDKSEDDKRSTEKLIIVPSSELLLNTVNDVPNQATPTQKTATEIGKSEKKTDKPKTKAHEE